MTTTTTTFVVGTTGKGEKEIDNVHFEHRENGMDVRKKRNNVEILFSRHLKYRITIMRALVANVREREYTYTPMTTTKSSRYRQRNARRRQDHRIVGAQFSLCVFFFFCSCIFTRATQIMMRCTVNHMKMCASVAL